MAKKSKKPVPAKTKKTSELDNVIFADGKNTEDPDIAKVKQLEEILGIKKMNPFGTTNIEVFKERLSEMTNVDLQHLCERVGIFASGSRQELKQKLLREFKSTNKGSISMTVENPAVKLDPNNPLHQKTLKILGEI
jgi:hypothetical protein